MPLFNVFQKMRDGLSKTRKTILGGLDNIFKGFTSIDDSLYDELEELLIASDMGVAASADIIESLRAKVKAERITEPDAARAALLDEIAGRISGAAPGQSGAAASESHGAAKAQAPFSPSVLLVVGVNGVGKTTTIGKLVNIYVKEGKKAVVAAADTFRAAAIDQLEVWCKRAGVEMIRHQENSDPAAVVFDAIQAAKARRADVLVCDTAGRLHNKKNLMEELRKIFRIIAERYPEASREIYLIIDATTGQNGLQQAKLFKETAEVTGIVLTKMDGTAKGGIIIPILSELGIPVKYVGVGEGIEDLQPFDAETFARALLEN